VNPSEGRVPVSWNECADWLDAGGVVLQWNGTPTAFCANDFRGGQTLSNQIMPPSDYRLLPPPGLVAAPECMDGGGWLGQGKDVPDGWEWRHMTDSGWLQSVRPTFGDDMLVQCRPPVRVRDVVEVPLTRLVGRTIEGCDEAAFRTDSPQPPPGAPNWRWRPAGDALWRPFPAGSLDLDTGRVRVYAEGDEK